MALDHDTFELFLNSIRTFVRDRLVPAENHVEEHDEVPDDIVAEMKEMGLFGLGLPEEYGGFGLSVLQECQVQYEFGQTAIAFRSVFGTSIGIGSQGILMDGTPEQKREVLPRVARGELVMSFALTEPDAGSDAASLTTRAELDGEHYVINGAKRYITNASKAGAFTLMARTGGPGAGGVSAFLVPAGAPGITLGKNDKKMGQRGAITCDVIFEDVRVPASSIIGGVPGQGFRTAMKVLDKGRLTFGATACGMAQRILADSIRYARERRQFGKPIGEFQLVQAMLADSQAELFAGWAMVQDLARRFEAAQQGGSHGQGQDGVSLMAACSKMFCSEMVGRVADRGVQIHGGAGYMNDYPVERFYRDARLLRLYEGTTQIQQMIIGRELVRGVR